MATELVKMSPKGQLVVPQNVREKEKFKEGDRFIPFHVKGGILFKKVKIPDIKVEFEKFSKEISEQFEKQNIRREDIAEAVRRARKR